MSSGSVSESTGRSGADSGRDLAGDQRRIARECEGFYRVRSLENVLHEDSKRLVRQFQLQYAAGVLPNRVRSRVRGNNQ